MRIVESDLTRKEAQPKLIYPSTTCIYLFIYINLNIYVHIYLKNTDAYRVTTLKLWFIFYYFRIIFQGSCGRSIFTKQNTKLLYSNTNLHRIRVFFMIKRKIVCRSGSFRVICYPILEKNFWGRFMQIASNLRGSFA